MAIPEFTRESKYVYRLIVVLNGYLRFNIAQLGHFQEQDSQP